MKNTYTNRWKFEDFINFSPLLIGLVLIVLAGGCGANADSRNEEKGSESLVEEFSRIVSEAPGMVGVAYVSDTDTMLLNNGVRYPMMSVFKLHQALAVAKTLEERGESMDSVLTIRIADLDRDTWSPMLKENEGVDFLEISVGQLVDYALSMSDNNASNVLFRSVVGPAATDSLIRVLASDASTVRGAEFNISWTEADMKSDHSRAYDNYTTPLSAALLIRGFMETGAGLTEKDCELLTGSLTKVMTGADRLGMPLRPEEGIVLAHKTGSGYRNERGELVCHNDVGYFRLPDGRGYALAVLIRDFRGTESEASAIIAALSQAALMASQRSE